MNPADLQIQLFHQIKSRMGAGLSMVDEVAQLLQISTDSAYRRIRGEKPLTFDEIYRLCLHYHCSLDALMGLQSNTYTFEGRFVQSSNFRFDEYLTGLMQQVKYMNGFKEKKMYYLAKDIPIFHHFHYRPIAAFKYFFWMRTLLNAPGMDHRQFSLQDYPDDLFAIGRKALDYYNGLDATELWNIETIMSTLRQVEYYQDARIFKHAEDIHTVYDYLEQLLLHLEKQADLGYKFDVEDENKKPLGAFQMYFNEVTTADNSILAVLDGTKVVFLTHSIINFMVTRHLQFCDNLFQSIQNLIRRSTLISSVSERERARFFKKLRNRITSRKQNLKA